MYYKLKIIKMNDTNNDNNLIIPNAYNSALLTLVINNIDVAYQRETIIFSVNKTHLFKCNSADFIDITALVFPNECHIDLLKDLIIRFGDGDYIEGEEEYLLTIPFSLLRRICRIQKRKTEYILFIPKNTFYFDNLYGIPNQKNPYKPARSILITYGADVNCGELNIICYLFSCYINKICKITFDINKPIHCKIKNYQPLPINKNTHINLLKYDRFYKNLTGFFVNINVELTHFAVIIPPSALLINLGKREIDLFHTYLYKYDSWDIQLRLMLYVQYIYSGFVPEHKSIGKCCTNSIMEYYYNIPWDVINIILKYSLKLKEYVYWIPICPKGEFSWNSGFDNYTSLDCGRVTELIIIINSNKIKNECIDNLNGTLYLCYYADYEYHRHKLMRCNVEQ